ncbi:hypothetical protein [Salinispora arenicola]|uniref:Uncharacterized protein n=1 Tax=Salinispora arenicola TaxID=168697 RepID=A0ABQ4JQX5_SALAC|nr:hypothetical protein [Salinispora arenicola]GIM85150.1 hypothetical protein Sar04_21070 [Salinispora arenicola]
MSTEEPGTARVSDDDRPVDRSDDDRPVDRSDDGRSVLPEQTVDDTDRGWGEHFGGNDAWLLEQRPPHWG